MALARNARILSSAWRAIAAIPGLGSLGEALFPTPGSWLYRYPTISWLSDPALVRQLPCACRWFAADCTCLRRDPIGAEMLLRGIIAARRSSGTISSVPLRLEGATVFLDLHDPRFLTIPRELLGLTNLLRPFLGPGDTFINIGANHGTYSIAAAGLVAHEGFVISIEPQPRLADAVRASLAASQAPHEVHQIACGDCSQSAPFFIPLATSGSGGLFRKFSARSRHRTIHVAMRQIDDVIDPARLPGRVLIKLDVEGSEVSVLRCARRLIQPTRPAILTEVNAKSLAAAGASAGALIETLRDLGYDRYVTRSQPRLARPLTSPLSEPDIIALHSEA